MQLGPGSRSAWASSSSSMRLTRTKEEPAVVDLSRNKFSMLNMQDSGPASISGYPSQPPSHDSGYDSLRTQTGGPSRSMYLPGRGTRGTSADDRKVDASRQTRVNRPRDHAEAAGPAASMGPSASGRPVPETIWEVNRVLEQSKQLRGKPDKSLAEIEKQSKLLLDEFLQNGNEQVNVFRRSEFLN
jgi:hypothetical protein